MKNQPKLFIIHYLFPRSSQRQVATVAEEKASRLLIKATANIAFSSGRRWHGKHSDAVTDEVYL